MKVETVQLVNFKRFTKLKIDLLPATAKLIILVGPNGSGKTSLFEGFKQWHNKYSGFGINSDLSYISKQIDSSDLYENVKITFYDQFPDDDLGRKKSFYFRSAYRHEADFSLSGMTRLDSSLYSQRFPRFIDQDRSVMENYQRLVTYAVDSLFNNTLDEIKVGELKEVIIGRIRKSMLNVFEDLVLSGVGRPLENGSFYFHKGSVNNFHFKNLSGGEKAAFDLLLDLIIKTQDFDNTVFCIDEPDLHMHTKLQGKLLNELFQLIPENSQLWISTHSIGMMRKAKDISTQHPDKVIFLNFGDINPDEEVHIKPIRVSREFWKATLKVALDDMAELVSPKQIVLCEGAPLGSKGKNKEFDALCLNKIFGNHYPDVEFISVGDWQKVTSDHLDLKLVLERLNPGVEIIRIIDLDDRNSSEIADLKKQGVKVLLRRDLENYLFDDEIVIELCKSTGNEDKVSDCLNIKKIKIDESVSRGNAKDDVKSAAGSIYVEFKKILRLTQSGNSVEAFCRDIMAPLISSQSTVYKELEKSIFS